jgi:hypothetical protein
MKKNLISILLIILFISNVEATPTTSIYANPATISAGQQTSIYWSGTNATSCSMYKNGTVFYTGSNFFSSAFYTGPLSANTVYKIICTDQSGNSSQAETTVTVSGGVVNTTITTQLINTTLKDTAMSVSGYSYAKYDTPVGKVSYVAVGTNLMAYKEGGTLLWSKNIGYTVSGVGGGLDLQGDGYPEVVTAALDIGNSTYVCGSTTTNFSSVYIVDGKTGNIMTSSSGANCIEESIANNYTFVAQKYPQYSVASVIFGAGPNYFMTRSYETMGWAIKFSNSSLLMNGTAIYPSTQSFAATYPQASMMYNGLKFVPQSHSANGLVININNQPHVVYFTSGKALVFNMGGNTITPLPLIYDNNFISHKSSTDSYNDEGAQDCFDGCRNYGLVRRLAEFTSNPNLILLLSGTNSFSLAYDSLSGNKSYDVWGGIARKLVVYNPLNNIVSAMRYYSYAHDTSGTHKYGGRLTYPSDPIMVLGGKVYTLHNIYNQVDSRSDASLDDRWFISINEVQTNGTLHEYKLYNYYLWDTIEDSFGKKYLLISPTQGYFPKKMSNNKPLVQLVEMVGVSSFVVRAEYVGIPKSVLSMRNDKTSDSSGYLFKPSIIGGQLELSQNIGY